ncbi:MAG TPA: competence/damage-inducible protein A [Candidatus Acidoferrales bacterium]|nr:competence/damage-inducible protein A [Candidatus Acidoferrales bacterium]
MQIEIVTIGNEVLSGRTLDTNFAFLARLLEEASVQVTWHSTVGDTAERIAEGLTRALDRADAVIMTGGLGPTPDDVTRKAVATVLSRPLQLDEGVLASIRERGRRMGRKLPATVETMALIPRGAEIWANPVGSAPGLLLLHREKPVILLPGVPHEMEALAREHVAPYLGKRTGRTIESLTLRTYGAYESQLHERIGALPESWPGAALAYLPSWFGVDLRLTVAGPNAAAVRDTAARGREELLARVRGVVYTEGSASMEDVVGALLVRRGWRIATAESCTGGLLAKRLTDVPGASRYVERGFVTYSNASKLELLGVDAATLEAQGAVSAAVAEQMAGGARTRAGADVGVGITGIAGPDGGSEAKPVGMVYVALVSPLGDAVRVLRLSGSRSTIRERAAQTALDFLRRHLLELPIDPTLD